MIEIPKTGLRQFIRDLAERHGVRYARTHVDELAETFTRLSGDDVTPDEVEMLAIALKRAGVITGREMGALLAAYLREKKTVEALAPADALRGSVLRYDNATTPVDVDWNAQRQTSGDIVRTMTPQSDFMPTGKDGDEH